MEKIYDVDDCNVLKDMIVESIHAKLMDICNESVLLLNEVVFNDFKGVLSEEFGIRDKTRMSANDIVDNIKERIKNSNVIKDQNGLKHYIGEFEYEFDNGPIKIKYNVINFVNDEIYDRLVYFYDFKGSFNKKKNYIYVPIAMLNGKFLVDTANSTIQHELSHVFDDYVYKGRYITDKTRKLYSMVVEQINNPSSELSKELALALYLTFKTEQIAMANSLDSLYNHDRDKILDYRETNEYRLLLNLKNVIIHFEDYIVFVKGLYRLRPESVLKWLKMAYNDYLRRLGRVVARYRIWEE